MPYAQPYRAQPAPGAAFAKPWTRSTTRATAHARPLPPGYGLVLAAILSLGLWAGLIWGALRLVL